MKTQIRNYKLCSAKGTRDFRGTLGAACLAAMAMDVELHAFNGGICERCGMPRLFEGRPNHADGCDAVEEEVATDAPCKRSDCGVYTDNASGYCDAHGAK